jgi:hypothetical protein
LLRIANYLANSFVNFYLLFLTDSDFIFHVCKYEIRNFVLWTSTIEMSEWDERWLNLFIFGTHFNPRLQKRSNFFSPSRSLLAKCKFHATFTLIAWQCWRGQFGKNLDFPIFSFIIYLVITQRFCYIAVTHTVISECRQGIFLSVLLDQLFKYLRNYRVWRGRILVYNNCLITFVRWM